LKFRQHIEVLKKSKPLLANGEVKADTNWQQLIERMMKEYDTAAGQESAKKEIKTKLDEFRRKIWEINHHGEMMPGDENEEIVVVGSQEEIKECPITGQPLEEPVKNRECGHTYSRMGIEHLIKSASKTRRAAAGNSVKCPVSGCSKLVNMDSLETNVALLVMQERSKHDKKKPPSKRKRATKEEKDTPAEDGVEDLTQGSQ